MSMRYLISVGVLLASTPVYAQALEEMNCEYMGTCQSQGMSYMAQPNGGSTYHPADGGRTDALSAAAAAAAAGAYATGNAYGAFGAAAAGLGLAAAFSAAVDNGDFSGGGAGVSGPTTSDSSNGATAY